jgi:hypothetical protein
MDWITASEVQQNSGFSSDSCTIDAGISFCEAPVKIRGVTGRRGGGPKP